MSEAHAVCHDVEYHSFPHNFRVLEFLTFYVPYLHPAGQPSCVAEFPGHSRPLPLPSRQEVTKMPSILNDNTSLSTIDSIGRPLRIPSTGAQPSATRLLLLLFLPPRQTRQCSPTSSTVAACWPLFCPPSRAPRLHKCVPPPSGLVMYRHMMPQQPHAPRYPFVPRIPSILPVLAAFLGSLLLRHRYVPPCCRRRTSPNPHLRPSLPPAHDVRKPRKPRPSVRFPPSSLSPRG